MKAVEKSIPVYKKFQKELRQKLLSGQWAPGQRLPSEREFQETYNISRPTINKSLNELAEEGLLTRCQGRGTFVSDNLVPVRDVSLGRGIGQHLTVKYIAPGRNGMPASAVRFGILEGVHQQLDPLGHSAMVDFFNSIDQYDAALRKLPETCSAAIIWNKPDENPEVFEFLRKRKFPFVLVDSYPEKLELDYVVSDNITGGRMMVDHLVSLGHRNIVFLTMKYHMPSVRGREVGFIHSAISAGIPVNNDSIIPLEGTESSEVTHACVKEGIPAAMKELLSRPEPPTALCISNDLLALDVIQWLGANGIRVPEDMSVIGYDNIDLGEYSAVPLTTIGHNWMEVGQCAADVILQKFTGRTMRKPAQIMVKPSLVVRKSTSAPASR